MCSLLVSVVLSIKNIYVLVSTQVGPSVILKSCGIFCKVNLWR